MQWKTKNSSKYPQSNIPVPSDTEVKKMKVWEVAPQITFHYAHDNRISLF